jgi:cell division transport system permease protein
MLTVSLNLAFGMEKSTRKKILGGYPAVGVVISTTLALFVIGLFGNLLIYGREFGNIVRENLNVKVYLKGSLTETQRNQLEKTISSKEFVATSEKPVVFVSKEQAEKDLIGQIGDYKQILGENPLKDAFVVRIDPAFQDTARLKVIKSEIEGLTGVLEATYEKHLFDSVNKNIRNISIYLLVISVLLLITTIILVNNTLRLALFSQRFLIRSMQLVGAKRWFILNPFLWRSMLYGMISGILAAAFIWLLSNYVQRIIPEIAVLHNPSDFIKMLGSLVIIGIVVSFCSTFFAINRYLRMSLDDLY